MFHLKIKHVALTMTIAMFTYYLASFDSLNLQ